MGEYTITLNIQRVENGQYLATSNDLAGLVAQGRIKSTLETCTVANYQELRGGEELLAAAA